MNKNTLFYSYLKTKYFLKFLGLESFEFLAILQIVACILKKYKTHY